LPSSPHINRHADKNTSHWKLFGVDSDAQTIDDLGRIRHTYKNKSSVRLDRDETIRGKTLEPERLSHI